MRGTKHLKSFIYRRLIHFFVQKKVLIGGDSRIFWYNIPPFILQKKCIIGCDSRHFGDLSGCIRGGDFHRFVTPFVTPIVTPNTKKKGILPLWSTAFRRPFKGCLNTSFIPLPYLSSDHCPEYSHSSRLGAPVILGCRLCVCALKSLSKQANTSLWGLLSRARSASVCGASVNKVQPTFDAVLMTTSSPKPNLPHLWMKENEKNRFK